MSDGLGVIKAIKAHPIISGVFGLCAVSGIVVAFVYGPADWPWPRSVLAGLFGGLVVAIFTTARFLLEASEDSEEDDGR